MSSHSTPVPQNGHVSLPSVACIRARRATRLSLPARVSADTAEACAQTKHAAQRSNTASNENFSL